MGLKLGVSTLFVVMPGLDPGIHAAPRRKRWREMPGTSPGMTEGRRSDMTERRGMADAARAQNPGLVSLDS